MKKADAVVESRSMSNSFQVFDLDVRFTIDLDDLDHKYRLIQALVHPDRFVHKTEAERRAAADQAIKINEAYQRLKNPIHRAEDFLKAKGYDVPGQQGQTVQHPTLLMKVMEWREELEGVQKTEDLDLLEEALQKRLEFVHQAMDTSDSLVYLYLELVYLTKILEEMSYHPLRKTYVRSTPGS